MTPTPDPAAHTTRRVDDTARLALALLANGDLEAAITAADAALALRAATRRPL